MKANEAPEKLYIALNELTESGRTFVLDHRVDYPTCTEYTRTDAFIKKAVRRLEHYLNNSVWVSNDVGVREKEVIIADFVNYLKGE